MAKKKRKKPANAPKGSIPIRVLPPGGNLQKPAQRALADLRAAVVRKPVVLASARFPLRVNEDGVETCIECGLNKAPLFAYRKTNRGDVRLCDQHRREAEARSKLPPIDAHGLRVRFPLRGT